MNIEKFCCHFGKAVFDIFGVIDMTVKFQMSHLIFEKRFRTRKIAKDKKKMFFNNNGIHEPSIPLVQRDPCLTLMYVFI